MKREIFSYQPIILQKSVTAEELDQPYNTMDVRSANGKLLYRPTISQLKVLFSSGGSSGGGTDTNIANTNLNFTEDRTHTGVDKNLDFVNFEHIGFRASGASGTSPLSRMSFDRGQINIEAGSSDTGLTFELNGFTGEYNFLAGNGIDHYSNFYISRKRILYSPNNEDIFDVGYNNDVEGEERYYFKAKLMDFANDADAAAGGVAIDEWYRTGGTPKIRVV